MPAPPRASSPRFQYRVLAGDVSDKLKGSLPCQEGQGVLKPASPPPCAAPAGAGQRPASPARGGVCPPQKGRGGWGGTVASGFHHPQRCPGSWTLISVGACPPWLLTAALGVTRRPSHPRDPPGPRVWLTPCARCLPAPRGCPLQPRRQRGLPLVPHRYPRAWLAPQTTWAVLLMDPSHPMEPLQTTRPV